MSAQAFTYHYKSNASLVDEITMPSGAKQSKQYDVMGRLTQIAARNGANALVNQFAYSYDRAGQRIQEATPGYTRSFAYNETRGLRPLK